MSTFRDYDLLPSIAIILFVVFLAGAIPAIIGGTSGDQTTVANVESNRFTTVDQSLETSLENTSRDIFPNTNDPLNDTTNASANISIYDSNANNPDALYLNLDYGNTTSIDFNGRTINITYFHQINSGRILVRFEYPANYGMDTISYELLRAIAVLVLIVFLAVLVILLTGGENNGNRY